MVIDGYDSEKSKIPRYNASSCGAEVGAYLEESGTLDTRLTVEVCDRLSEMERKSWEDYQWKKHQLGLQLIREKHKIEAAEHTKKRKRDKKEVVEPLHYEEIDSEEDDYSVQTEGSGEHETEEESPKKKSKSDGDDDSDEDTVAPGA